MNLETLKTLCDLPGVSSREDAVRDYIRAQAEPFADSIRTDTLGNLLVFKKGRRTPPQPVLLAAHMDEVGLMVTSITKEGYLKFDFVGGIDRRVVIGKRVLLGERRIPGVIGLKAIHLTTAEERKKVPKRTELSIDIGAKDKKAAERLVSLGDVGVFDSIAEEFGDGMLKAKAIDDRVGCALMLELLKEPLPMDCWFAFTVQEEVGTRGAFGAAFSVEPGFALVLEGTTAADNPDAPAHLQVCSPGRGAVLPAMDGGTIYDRALWEKLRAYAGEHNIPWQMKELISGGTDARAIQRTKTGARVVAVSAAVRYIHAPAGVACIRDFDAMLALARGFLTIVEGEMWHGSDV